MNLVSLSRSTDCIPAEREPATQEELRRQQLMEFDVQNFCAKSIKNHSAQKMYGEGMPKISDFQLHQIQIWCNCGFQIRREVVYHGNWPHTMPWLFFGLYSLHHCYEVTLQPHCTGILSGHPHVSQISAHDAGSKLSEHRSRFGIFQSLCWKMSNYRIYTTSCTM